MAFDVRSYEAKTGWHFSFHSYRSLPADTPFFMSIFRADLVGVRKLLSNQQAFITDRLDFHENTALHIAALQGDLEMCKLLISAGADPLALDASNLTPLHYISGSSTNVNYYSNYQGAYAVLENSTQPDSRFTPGPFFKPQPEAVIRFLLNAGADETLINDCSVIAGYTGPFTTFKLLRDQMYPPIAKMALDERFDLACSVLNNRDYNMPRLVQDVLWNNNCVDKEVLLMSDENNQETILHELLGRIRTQRITAPSESAYSQTSDDDAPPNYPSEPEYSNNTDVHLRKLVQQIVIAGSNIHARDKDGLSPLISLIYWTISSQWFKPVNVGDRLNYERTVRWTIRGFNLLHSLIQNWLDDLSSIAVDLQQYGEKEHYLFKHRYLDDDMCNRFDKDHYIRTMIIDFTYGPNVEDWKWWFSEPTDRYAGQFWSMVESPPEEGSEDDSCDTPCIPGSWIAD